ncbi:MAG: tetratricopeptide repeat protein [Armatimonadota bacterium]
MAGVTRWHLIALITLLVCAAPVLAGEQPTPPVSKPPASVTEDMVRLLELGKLLMGQNNPTYAQSAVKLDNDTRNAAGAQALDIFRRVVKSHPEYADGWLWLGIALTETLVYSKEHPKGKCAPTDAQITEGMQAFRVAYMRNPADLVTVSYYGEGLMVYQKDFDNARKLWEGYLRLATTDMQRVTALTQAGRACLNKAYFGKADNMPAEEIRKHYQAATDFMQKAAKLCPNSQEVKTMQELLKKLRKELLGK